MRDEAPLVLTWEEWQRSMKSDKRKAVVTNGVALLSSEEAYTIFSYGERSIRFAAPYSLRRYIRVKKWHNGYLEVDADYGDGIEEDYIDLRPILKNLMINPRTFLRPIKRVEVSYA